MNKIPSIVITKGTSGSAGATNWNVYTSITGPTKKLVLNTSAAEATNTTYWNDTAPTASVFSLGTTGDSNYNTSNYIAYCFANIDGYQRIGSYIGNGSANGPYIYTGFEPAWILIKNVTTNGKYWYIYDNKRSTTKSLGKELYANTTDREYDYDSTGRLVADSNGFHVASTESGINTSGATMIFMAIAANPDTTEPTKANSFKTKLYTGTGSTHAITGLGFKPDFIWTKNRDTTDSSALVDSVRGIVSPAPYLASDATTASATSTNMPTSVQDNGYTITGAGGRTNTSGEDYVSWNWKGADHDRNLAAINTDGDIPSVVSANPAAGFSIVKWTASSTASDTIGSGLGGTVEFLITKKLNGSRDWHVWHKDLPNNGYLSLNSAAAESTPNGNRATVTNNNTFIAESTSGDSMIAYCWREISGYSSIGTYTGNGSATGPTVTTGFEPSWVILKCISSGSTNWRIIDSARDTTNPRSGYLNADTNSAEETAYDQVNFLSNGFQLATTDTSINGNGNSHIYVAFK